MAYKRARRQRYQVSFNRYCVILISRYIGGSIDFQAALVSPRHKGTKSYISAPWIFRGCKFTDIQSNYHVSFCSVLSNI